MQTMNQVLFEPLSVAGWPKGAAWLSSGTLFARANFADALLYGPGKQQMKQIPPIPALVSSTTPEALVDAALDRLVDGEVEQQTRDALVAHAQTVADPAERAADVAYLVAASPEFQLA